MTRQTTVLLDRVLPEEAWNALAADAASVLVDIRPPEACQIAGIPDLSEIEREVWAMAWPDTGTPDEQTLFLSTLSERIAKSGPARLFFLCSVGDKSRDAAEAMASHLGIDGTPLHLSHIREGFDGTDRKANPETGWKGADLPWVAG